VKLVDVAREMSVCECSNSFCSSSERVFDWCCDGKDLAMLSTADVNWSPSLSSTLQHSTALWTLGTMNNHHNLHIASISFY